LRQKLRRDFLQEISWPVIQLVAAVLVIAGLIYVTGYIATVQGRELPDPLGIGLAGEEGAKRFLELVGVTVLAGGTFLWLLKRLLRRQALVERLLLRLPLIGFCLRAMVLARFCLAL